MHLRRLDVAVKGLIHMGEQELSPELIRAGLTEVRGKRLAGLGGFERSIVDPEIETVV